MNVLITGGAGFIGSHLAEKMLALKAKVQVIDNLSTGSIENIKHLLNNKNFTFIYETILNENVMDRLVSNSDMVFHMAASVGVELIVKDPVNVIETNILGTEVVLKTANRYKKKLFIASTSEVYGKNDNVPFKEEDDSIYGPTTKSRWSYACSKAIDEFLALAFYKEYGLPVVIGRLFNTVGPRQTGKYGMVVPRFVERALKNEPLYVYGDGKQTRCFCCVYDTVEALIKLMNSKEAEGEIFNIGSMEEISIYDLANKVIQITDSKSHIKFLSYDRAYEKGFEDMRRRVPDISKIKKFIGFTPKYNLEKTIELIVKYFKEKNEYRSL